MGNRIRKKMKLDTKIKAGIICLLSVIVIGLGVYIFLLLTVEKYNTKEQMLYQYECQPQVGYTVHINENKIYEGTTMEEGMEYSKNLLDYIEVNYKIAFQGSEKAEVQLDYHIIGRVQGYKKTQETTTINWSKDYQLKGNTQVINTEESFTEEAGVEFKLDEYDKFATDARDITGIQVPAELLVYLEGTMNIITEYGNLTTPIYSVISIKLLDTIFGVTKGDITPITDGIDTLVKEKVPINYSIIIACSFVILVCLTSILIICLTTETPSIYDKLNSKANRFVKNYGSRMIAIHNKNYLDYNKTYEVLTIVDLIKLSDEINKPIFYIKEDFDLNDYAFHVEDGDNLYIYHVT